MFYNTMGGRTFFEAHVPALIKALRQIGEALTKMSEKDESKGQDLNCKVDRLEETVDSLLTVLQASTVDPSMHELIESLRSRLKESDESDESD